MAARVSTALLAALVPALLAFRSGGYFPSEWGVVLLVLVLVGIVVALLAERTGAGRLDLALVGALVAFALWSLLSVVWSPGPDAPVLAAERVLVYACAAGVLVLGLSRERVEWLLAGLVAGIGVVGLWALETRLFAGDLGTPGDVLSGTRLVRPLGYANGLGALVALGFLIALGLALWGSVPALRLSCAALLVPLAAALELTLSRGSLVALGAGLLVLLVPERRRETVVSGLLLLVAPAAAAALAAASPLTRAGLHHGEALAAGHRLAVELVLLALAGSGASLAARRYGAKLARALPVAAGVLALALAAALLAAGPMRLVEHLRARVEAPAPATSGDLNRRVLSVSGSGRSAYWRVAWRMVEREPLLGTGAGSYERWWLQERPVPNAARNAHDLYLETLAELGPVGLALLLAALGIPLWAARRAAGPLATTLLAAYVAWLVHALLDWDWQIPAVTLPALGCGVALVVLARTREDIPLTARRRAAALVPLALALGAALVIHTGNRATADAEAAIARGDDARALAAARRARGWAPWAALPWQLAGEAQLATHRDAEARASLRHALDTNGAEWSAWYDLASVTAGAERAAALRRARALDPLAPELR